MKTSGLPPLLEAVIRFLTPRGRQEEVLGDLEESHRRRSGPGASVATWMEGLGLVPHLIFEGCLRGAANVRSAATGPAARLALRANLRHPLLSFTALLALAVGTGLALSGHLLLEAVLRSELDLEHGDRFVLIEPLPADRGAIPVEVDGDLVAVLRGGVPELEYLGVSQGTEGNLFDEDGGVTPVRIAAITPTAFAHLPMEPLLGRTLGSADGRPSAGLVAVASADFFRSRLGGDPSWIGRTMRLGSDAWTLVGVAPDDFRFPSAPDLWLPLEESGLTLAGRAGDRRMFGVLAAGVSAEASERRLQSVVDGYRSGRGAAGGTNMEVYGFTDVLRGSTVAEVTFRGLMVVLVLILLVIAGNVANLMTARNAARRMDISIRRALGAGRGHIVAQLSMEVLAISAVATVVGAWGAARLMAHFRSISTEMPYWVDFGLGARGAAVAVGLALGTTLVGGTLPALRATRESTGAPGTGRGSVPRRAFGPASSFLIATQIAVSGALLLAALLGAQGLGAYAEARSAVGQADVVTAQLAFTDGSGNTRDAVDSLRALTRRLAADPTIATAGLTDALPGRLMPPRPVELERADTEPAPVRASVVHVADGYLETVTHVTRGRPFVEEDLAPGALPVAVVSASFLRAEGVGARILGRRIRTILPSGDPGPWAEVIGVVADPDGAPEVGAEAPSVYLPLVASPWVYVAVRPRSDPAAFASALPGDVARERPDVLTRRVATLAAVGDEDRAFMTALASALFGLGAVALLLSAAGLFAVTSFAVSRRTREIGVRVALGATGSGIVRAVGGRSARALLAGAVGAAVLGTALLQVRRLFLFPVPDPDVALYAGVLGVLLLAGAGATALPLRRALAIRPKEALRAE